MFSKRPFILAVDLAKLPKIITNYKLYRRTKLYYIYATELAVTDRQRRNERTQINNQMGSQWSGNFHENYIRCE